MSSKKHTLQVKKLMLLSEKRSDGTLVIAKIHEIKHTHCPPLSMLAACGYLMLHESSPPELLAVNGPEIVK